jgi:hypothetical protein
MTFKTTTLSGALADSRKVLNLPAAQYHDDIDVQSCSLLKPMLASPAHYKAQFFENRASSKAKGFGTLIHTLVLEPQTLASRYAVYPGLKDGREAEYKAFVQAHPLQTVIADVPLQAARRMAEKILERRFRGRRFGDYLAEGEKEVTIYYTDPTTGVRCRVRIDLLHPEFVFDLKTALSVVQGEWLRQALSLDYDLQSYMYSLAECLWAGRQSPLPFVFVVGENTCPHSVSAFTAGESFLVKGGRKYQEAIGAYAACSKVNHWPDLGCEETLELEHWMAASAANEPAWRSELAQP